MGKMYCLPGGSHPFSHFYTLMVGLCKKEHINNITIVCSCTKKTFNLNLINAVLFNFYVNVYSISKKFGCKFVSFEFFDVLIK